MKLSLDAYGSAASSAYRVGSQRALYHPNSVNNRQLFKSGNESQADHSGYRVGAKGKRDDGMSDIPRLHSSIDIV